MLRNSIPEVRNKYAVLAEVFSSTVEPFIRHTSHKAYTPIMHRVGLPPNLGFTPKRPLITHSVDRPPRDMPYEGFDCIWIDGKTTGKVQALFLRKTSIGTAPDEKGPKITVMN